MFFLSKFVGTLAAPGTLLLLVLALAWLLQPRRPAASRWLLGLAVFSLLLLAVAPVSNWVLLPLEERFPADPEPAHVDGIIVLGGAIEGAGGRVFLNEQAQRVTALVALARRYPQARLVYSGGSGSVVDDGVREADLALPLLTSLGVDPARLLLERESRNTWENALYSQRLAQPRAGETWLLVTSAWHMPRSVGCFRGVHWPVVAYPVSYKGHRRSWGEFEIAQQLQTLREGIKEWIGLVSYRILGHIPELLPGPQEAG